MRKTTTALAIALVAAVVPSAAQQLGTPGRIDTGFDVIMKQGGIMDMHTMKELDQKRQSQVQTRSEATVSKLDLKAPGKARNEYNKGMQFLSRNDLQSAVTSFNKALAIYPEFVAAHNALGCTYFKLKQNDLAREHFARAIELDDHVSSSYLNLGRTELALGDRTQAQAAFEKASSLSPLDANLLVVLAYVQFLNHDYAATIQTAQRAHGRPHPGTATVHYFSAASWQAQKQFDKTQAELQTFLDEDPHSPFADEARRIIRQLQEHPEPVTLASTEPSIAFEATTPATASLRGQKVLQDLREKQQIAEAETEGIPDAAPTLPRTPAAAVPGPSIRTPNTDSGFTFHSKAEEVAVFFTATDHGKSVTNLTREDVSLLDDDKPPASVLGFHSQSGLPLRLGLLIDTSVSVRDRFGFEQTAAGNFLREVLTGKNDVAFVAGFSNSVVMVQDYTADNNKLTHGIGELVPIGGTAVWDAVCFAADKLAEAKDAQPVAKVLVLISDGDDNSSIATLKQAIERAERDEVIIYTVSTRNSDPTNDNDLTGNHAMRVLAELTGGASFFPGSADRLKHSLTELQEVIRSRYLIGYKPADFTRDGRYRSVLITARQSGHKLKVNARKGYYTDVAATAGQH